MPSALINVLLHPLLRTLLMTMNVSVLKNNIQMVGSCPCHHFWQELPCQGICFRFLDWLDFEDEFRKDFMLLDAEATAINVLETTAYFQGKRSVDDYLDQFRNLIYDSGYTDAKTVVVKLCQGLDRRISMALAGMAFRRRSDTDPEAWFRLAVRIDQNRAADEAFHISH